MHENKCMKEGCHTIGKAHKAATSDDPPLKSSDHAADAQQAGHLHALRAGPVGGPVGHTAGERCSSVVGGAVKACRHSHEKHLVPNEIKLNMSAAYAPLARDMHVDRRASSDAADTGKPGRPAEAGDNGVPAVCSQCYCLARRDAHQV